MQLIQASFFWKNNEPGGIGFTFSTTTGFKAEDLEEIFMGSVWKDYARNTDAALGTGIINAYFEQLEALSLAKFQNKRIPVQDALLMALNIYWLTSRGFIPNDEFNGYQFVTKTEA